MSGAHCEKNLKLVLSLTNKAQAFGRPELLVFGRRLFTSAGDVQVQHIPIGDALIVVDLTRAKLHAVSICYFLPVPEAGMR